LQKISRCAIDCYLVYPSFSTELRLAAIIVCTDVKNKRVHVSLSCTRAHL